MKTIQLSLMTINEDTYLAYEFEEDDETELDEDILDLLEEGQISGVVPTEYLDDDDAIVFKITGKKTLAEYLALEVSSKELLPVMENLVSTLSELKENGILVSNLIMNRNYIYVDPKTYAVEFICLPIEEELETMEIPSFIRMVMANIQYADEVNADYVPRILTCINHPDDFQIDVLLDKIHTIMDDYGMEIHSNDQDIIADFEEVAETAEEAFEEAVEEAVEEAEKEVSEEIAATTEEEEVEETAATTEEEEVEETVATTEEEVAEEAAATQEEVAEESAEEENAVSEEEEEETIVTSVPIGEDTKDRTMVVGGMRSDGSRLENLDEGDRLGFDVSMLSRPITGQKKPLKISTEEQEPIEDAVEETVDEKTTEEVKQEIKDIFLKDEDTSDDSADSVEEKPDEINLAAPEVEDDLIIDAPKTSAPTLKVSRVQIMQKMKAEEESEQAEQEETATENEEAAKEATNEEQEEKTAKSSGKRKKKKEKEQEKPEEEPVKEAAPVATLKVNPYLIRINTEERIMITKNNFRIGKASIGTDYTVTGNGAVNNKHAVIYSKNGVYYLKDNKSYSTYLNGEQVLPSQDAVLEDNAVIVLGNEEFKFKLS